MGWIRSVETNKHVIREFNWAMTLKFSQPVLKTIVTNIPKEIKIAIEQASRDYKKQMLVFPTKTQLRILAYLIDDQGHPQWEISDELGLDEGRTSSDIKKLRDWGLIYEGKKRPSTHEKTRSRKPPEKRPETPLYIKKELNCISDLCNRVEMRLEHLGAKAPQTLVILSEWLENTQEACMKAGEEIRLDPRPFSDSEIQALSMGRWPPVLQYSSVGGRKVRPRMSHRNEVLAKQK